jgi:hypothetical protein
MGWDYVSVELRPLTALFSMPQMIHDWIWSSDWMTLTGENRRTQRETCPRATLSTTSPIWTGLVSNPGLSGEKPTKKSCYWISSTDRLQYAMLEKGEWLEHVADYFNYSLPRLKSSTVKFVIRNASLLTNPTSSTHIYSLRKLSAEMLVWWIRTDFNTFEGYVGKW